MLKNTFLQLVFLFAFATMFGQYGPQQIISADTDNAYLSIPLDIDNDGAIDVLKSSGQDYTLKWHRNLDGLGNFGPEILISDDPALYLSIDFVDLDSDGDKDLLFHENNPSVAGWFENLDGMGTFGPVQILIDVATDYIFGISPADIDNDGDIDIIALRSNTFVDRIVWYENVNGSATFSNEVVLTDGLFYAIPPVVTDIDSDGLLDLLVAHENGGGPANLVWFRNLGNTIFDTETEIYHFDYINSDWTSITSLKLADVNADTKLDIVISTRHDDLGNFHHWFENLDDQGSFGAIQLIPINGIFHDVDNDGDNDIITGNRYVDRIYWVENSDGLGTFTTERNITTEIDFLKDIKAADFNNDGLLDVVSASLGDDKVAWYENTGILAVAESTKQQFILYPNPTDGKVNVHSEFEVATIDVYDVSGKRIDNIKMVNTFDLSFYEAGMYLVKLTSEEGTSETVILIKE